MDQKPPNRLGNVLAPWWFGAPTHYANPTRFLGLARALTPWTLGIAATLLIAGLYLALFVAPPDYQQGEAARIMYVHVPAAWMAMFVYMCIAVSSAVAFVWKHPLADVAAKASAPIGAVFTGLALITGMLWGEPMWGTWWVWDARLTSVLILFFLYLGYMALSSAERDGDAADGGLVLHHKAPPAAISQLVNPVHHDTHGQTLDAQLVLRFACNHVKWCTLRFHTNPARQKRLQTRYFQLRQTFGQRLDRARLIARQRVGNRLIYPQLTLGSR